jgi:hypothetical protein
VLSFDHGCTGTVESTRFKRAGHNARLFLWLIAQPALNGMTMTQIHSKSRQQAEIAFGHTQTQFFAKDRAVEELDSIVHAREAKTLRLREARMAKESEAQTKAISALIMKRAKR